MNEIKEYTEKIFEDIKYIEEKGCECWLTRELMKSGYKQLVNNSSFQIDDNITIYNLEF